MLPKPDLAPAIPVHFILLPGFLMLDLAGPAEALRIANKLGARFDLHYVSPAADPVSSLGIPVGGVGSLPSQPPAGGWVFIPGLTSAVFNTHTDAHKATVKWLAETWCGKGKLITICSAALLAGEAGLLDGRRCTTHHSLTERLSELAPKARIEAGRVFVVDGQIASSAGITTGIDLTLELIAQVAGPKVALDVAREMVVWLRRDGDAPQLSPYLAHRNHMHPAIHRVQDAIAANPTQGWTRTELADIACVSPRHLDRLFKLHAGVGPVDYRQQMQLAQVEPLLHGEGSLEHIAEAGGFGSARDLRRVWLKQRGTPLHRSAPVS